MPNNQQVSHYFTSGEMVFASGLQQLFQVQLLCDVVKN